MIHTNLQKYVNVKCQIGISRIREGVTQLPVIYQEALESLAWSETHKGHHIFYIEDIGKTTNEQKLTNIEEGAKRFVEGRSSADY